MAKFIFFTKKCRQSNYQKQFTFIYVFIFIMFIMSIKFSASQSEPSPTDCILNFQKNGTFGNSNSQTGQWGGFIGENCSRGAFKDYLYALGKHVNQTGHIYLNETEQKACFGTENDFISTCGVENLRSGNGGCSDFSVEDVNYRMGGKIKRLRESCGFSGAVGGEHGACGSCVTSWKVIRGIHDSRISIGTEDESDVCRFAVLISLTSSRVEDLDWVRKIYACLEEQDGDMEHAKKYAIIGGIITAAAIILVFIVCSMRKLCKSNFLSRNCAKLNCIVPEEYNLPKISLEMIYAATNILSESNFLGEGTSGKVYKGVLPNKRKIAVKHIINDKFGETFLREISCLSQIRHPNLVALLGYCEKNDEFFLIYELCPNGDLSEWLFGKNKVLSWIQRLEIALDSARGLLFLHTYPGRCIVHRDIKPTNILLGTSFRAKLSDFGFSKVIGTNEFSVVSEVRGTFGYIDPDYLNDCLVNTSSDVYSFGIVLLQIISGKKVVDMNLKKPTPIHQMARTVSRSGGGIVQFVDPKLEGEYSSEAFNLTFDLALSCTASKRQRPSMDEVVLALEKALHISKKARAPTPYTSPIRFSTGSSSSPSSTLSSSS